MFHRHSQGSGNHYDKISLSHMQVLNVQTHDTIGFEWWYINSNSTINYCMYSIAILCKSFSIWFCVRLSHALVNPSKHKTLEFISFFTLSLYFVLSGQVTKASYYAWQHQKWYQNPYIATCIVSFSSVIHPSVVSFFRSYFSYFSYLIYTIGTINMKNCYRGKFYIQM